MSKNQEKSLHLLPCQAIMMHPKPPKGGLEEAMKELGRSSLLSSNKPPIPLPLSVESQIWATTPTQQERVSFPRPTT